MPPNKCRLRFRRDHEALRPALPSDVPATRSSSATQAGARTASTERWDQPGWRQILIAGARETAEQLSLNGDRVVVPTSCNTQLPETTLSAEYRKCFLWESFAIMPDNVHE